MVRLAALALAAVVVALAGRPLSIFSWVSDAWNSVTSAVSSVWDAIKGIYHWVTGLFSLVTDVFGHLWDAATWVFHGLTWLFDTIVEGFGHAFTFAWHILTNVIPHAIEWVLSHAIKWAKAALLAAYHFVRGLVSKAIRFVVGVAHRLFSFLRSLVGKAFRVLGTIWHWLWSMGKKAVDLVLHPWRLVTWILPHLLLPLFRFLFEHSLPVLRWILGLFEREAMAVAHTLESVLSKVL